MNQSACRRTLFVAACLSLQAPAHAGCFSIYDAKNALVFESGTSPIDLSRSISEEMARRFPTRYLVVSTTINCGNNVIGTETTRFGGGAFAATSPVAGGAAANPYDAPVPPVRTRRRRSRFISRTSNIICGMFTS